MTDLDIDDGEPEDKSKCEGDWALDPDMKQYPSDYKSTDREAIHDLGPGCPPATINTRDRAENHRQEKCR